MAVKESLNSMTDHCIQCGPVDCDEPEEMVELRWVDNDRNFGAGYALLSDMILLSDRS